MHLQAPQLAGQLARFRLQTERDFGGAYLAGGALEEAEVELRLQLADGHADGRGDPTQGSGGGREGTVVEHRQKDLHGIASERHFRYFIRKIDSS